MVNQLKIFLNVSVKTKMFSKCKTIKYVALFGVKRRLVII